MVITSLENKEIKTYAKLKQKKYRDSEKRFLVEGKHLVEEAKRANLLLKVIVTNEDEYNFPSKLMVTQDIMKKLSVLETPPNIIGVCKMREEEELANKVLVLDGIQDPGNMGTIIRSAVAFSVSSSKTLTNSPPIILRFVSGSATPANKSKKRSVASI